MKFRVYFCVRKEKKLQKIELIIKVVSYLVLDLVLQLLILALIAKKANKIIEIIGKRLVQKMTHSTGIALKLKVNNVNYNSP